MELRSAVGRKTVRTNSGVYPCHLPPLRRRHGATFTHLFVIGRTAVPAQVLLALSAIVAYAKRGQLTSLARML